MRTNREQAARLTRKNRTRVVPQAESLDDRVVPAVMGAGHGGFAVAGHNAYAQRFQEMRQQRLAQQMDRLVQLRAMRQERFLMMQERLQGLTASRTARLHPNFSGANATVYANLNPGSNAQNLGGIGSNFRSPAVVGATTPAGPLAAGSFAAPTYSAPPVASATSASSSMGSNASTPFSTGSGLVTNSTDTTTGTTTSTGGDNGDTVANPTSPNDFPYGPGGFYNIVEAPGNGTQGFF